MTVIISRRTCGDILAAHNWLRRNGYDCIRGQWLKASRFAKLERLPSGRISIQEGVMA